MDPFDDQDAVLGLDFPYRFCLKKLVVCRNLTRFQRASEGSGQSTRGRGDHVVQGGGVRLERIGRNVVVLCHCSVDPKNDGFLLGGQIGAANGPLDSLDANL